MITILATECDLVAVDKPAGIPVVPARGELPDACLRARLERQLETPLWVVHRIDRDTSGVVLFARSAEAHRALSIAFEERRTAKSYRAWVAGGPLPDSGRIETPLHAARRGKSRPALPGEAGARAASTSFRVLRRWAAPSGREVAALEVEPESGRHHQIRVHLRSVGAAILFDPLYGPGDGRALPTGAPCRRLALHAWRITLPATAPDCERRTFVAPLAPDLVALEAWLDAATPGA